MRVAGRGGGPAGEFHLRFNSVYVAVVLNSRSVCVEGGGGGEDKKGHLH